MLKSMTGFGKASCECEGRNITIEVKSLNSKQLDIITRIPNGYREKEPEMRSMISNRLQRGKIDMIISVEEKGDMLGVSLNKPLVRKYYNELKELANELGDNATQDFLSMVLKMPDIYETESEDITQGEWETVLKALDEALKKADDFRIQEGKMIEKDLLVRIGLITGLLEKVEPFEKSRFEHLKQKIVKDLHEFMETENVDKNRFEQELLYYLEKLDITEEKVRLKKHCEYFTETLHSAGSNGKKLIFISQEIGREINTLGSKANEANIQRLVVQMKDELEKIKEQLFNVL